MKDKLGKRILVAAIGGLISTIAASYILSRLNKNTQNIQDE
jgi:hypothetical protein